MAEQFRIFQCPQKCSKDGKLTYLQIGVKTCPNCGAEIEKAKPVEIGPDVATQAMRAFGYSPRIGRKPLPI